MGLFDFLKRKRPDDLVYRLIWFELQIAPAAYRFAIMPEQPILIGFAEQDGEPGATLLIRFEDTPDVYERTVEEVDALVETSGVLSLPATSEQAFTESGMERPSVHLRIAYADETRWEGVYDAGAVPDPLSILIRDTQALARRTMQDPAGRAIDGDTAHALLDPERNTAGKGVPSILVKVTVLDSGRIEANGRQVTLAELGRILEDLEVRNGGVWYSRESPEQEPPEPLASIIESVMDAIASRGLPVRLAGE